MTTVQFKRTKQRIIDIPAKKGRISWAGLAAALLVFAIAFLVVLVPINAHDPQFWVTLILAGVAYAGVNLVTSVGDLNALNSPGAGKWFLLPIALAIVTILLGLSGMEILHASRYASIIQVQDAEFTEDLPESAGTDSIALMDTASAKMLGDREIGALANVVSQFDVSDEYTQIDFRGKPKKVAPLDYAGFFKWFNNRKNGVPGYVTVDPVSMAASYQESESGMVYVPSAYFLEDAARHLWLKYPTLMMGNLHFEIDEEGRPYYIASIYKKTISLFGGTTVSGCVIMDPVTGATEKYDVADVPTWVDVVFPGNLICTQYNWYGNLHNGYLNSIFGKKGCKQVTTYSGDEEAAGDEAPTSDYGYVAKDGDIWIYTGVTSVNSDSSNIGFLLANERTGESHYFTVSGADEKSAMAAAEGEVQEKRYQASFPSLINVDGNPTYIMVLKDASGLVKLYATVNVQQYNLVTTASKQAECLKNYRKLLGIAEAGGDVSDLEQGNGATQQPVMTLPEDDEKDMEVTAEADITIAEIRYIDIDGNTFLYLITDQQEIYKAKVKNHEDMILLQEGESIHIGVSDNRILEWKR